MSSDRIRRALMIALMLLVPFAAACGAAEEPAEEPMAEEPAEEPMPEEPMEEPAEEEVPEEPAEPQIVGNIILSGENFEWGDVDGETQNYTWTVRVQNDTTSNLRINVRFDFLDDAEEIIKTERATVTLAPASGRTINQGGTMSYDDALRVTYSVADYDYEVAS